MVNAQNAAQNEEARLHGGGDTMTGTSVLNTEWILPASRPEAITTLLESVDRYNPQNASLLEDYLYNEQIENGTYDCLANLALLKLFQFNPSLVIESGWTDDSAYTIFLILLQALAHEPLGPDFNLCMALLGDQLTSTYSSRPALNGYKQLSELATLLQLRRFSQAWSLIQSTSDNEFSSSVGPTLTTMPRFTSILRRSIAMDAIRPSFRAIDRKRLGEWLGAESGDEDDEAEISNLLQELGWTVEGEMVRIPVDQENDTKPVAQSHEKIGLDKLSRLLKSTA